MVKSYNKPNKLLEEEIYEIHSKDGWKAGKNMAPMDRIYYFDPSKVDCIEKFNQCYQNWETNWNWAIFYILIVLILLLYTSIMDFYVDGKLRTAKAYVH